MAFVFKSARDLDKKEEKDYFILTRNKIRKLMKEKTCNNNHLIESLSQKLLTERKHSSFGSNQKRELQFFITKQQYSPGPGSYEINDDFIKKSFNKYITSANFEENNENDKNNDCCCQYSQNNLKLFITKEERFKVFNNNDYPGPGEYQLTNLPQIKNYFTKKYQINKSRSYLTKSLKRMISIPSKGNDFGYKIDSNGELILEENTNASIGNNNNKYENKSLSPGNYSVGPKFRKNILDWKKKINITKERENTITNKMNEKFKNKNMNILFDENNNNLNDNIKTEPTTNDLSRSFSIINYKDMGTTNNCNLPNENSNNNNLTKNKINTNTINNENGNLKDKKEDKKNISHNFFRILNDELRYKNILNKYLENKIQYPGPGEYNLPDEYEKIVNAKKCDNFGSTLSRGILFPLKREISIDIKKEDNNFQLYSCRENNKNNENNSQQDEFDKNNSSEKKMYKKNININRKDRKEKKDLYFLSLRKYNKSIKLEKSDNLDTEIEESQNFYINNNNNSLESTDEKRKKNKSKTKTKKLIENFGSLVKRFNEICKKEITPGVGSYSLVKTQENNYNKYQSKSPYNIIIQNLNKRNNKISNTVRNKFKNLYHKSPPVGLYSPELRDCIEYKCKKRCQKNTGNAPFLNKIERFFKIDNKNDFSNEVGKYNLIKEEKEIKQQNSPFTFNKGRNNILDYYKNKSGNNNTDNLGPGSYRNGSYFDWIKKSYNKNFN